MKKLLALFLSVLMVFSMATLLSSCGDSDDDDDTESSAVVEEESDQEDYKKSSKKTSKSDEELIIGEWEMKLDYNEIIKSAAEDSGEEIPFDLDLDDAEVSMFWTFDEDGICTLAFDQESANKVIEKYMDLIIDQLTDDPDQKEAYKKEMRESMDEDTFEPQEGEYELKDNKIYISGDSTESVMVYKFVNKNTIKITDIEDMDTDDDALAAFSELLPLTLKRK